MIAAVYDWSGFYIGANGGWGSSRKCWDFDDPVGGFVAARRLPRRDRRHGRWSDRLSLAGQHWVFGLEAQGNWADLQGNTRISLFFPRLRQTTPRSSFGLFTGQVGYAWNNVLLYVKGGAAVTQDKYEIYPDGSAGPLHQASCGPRQ